MALFRSERGIGRGEVAESQLEVPMFAAFMLICSLGLAVQHLILGNQSLTVALAISLVVFGGTVLRVEVGLMALLIAMLLSPEIELAGQATDERSVVVRYGDLLIIIIFIGVMVKLTFEGHLKLWQPSPVNAGIVTYYTVCIIATLLAYERSLPAWDKRIAFFVMLKMLEFYLIFFMVGHSVRRAKDLRFPLEPNTLGGYLVICICLALSLMLQAPQLRLKIIFFAIAMAGFIPLLHTLSRASYGGLIVGIVAIALLGRRYWILAVLAVVLGMSTIIMPEKVIERVAMTVQEDGGQDLAVMGQELGVKVDKSTYERVYVWRKVWFILSLGPEFFLFGGGVSWESVLDSQYARVFLETGVIGFLAFVFLQFRLLKTTRQAYLWTEDWLARGIALGMFATTLALIAHSAGTISFLIVRIMEPYWFLIALTVSIRNEAIFRHTQRLLTQKRAAQEAMPAPVKPEASTGGESAGERRPVPAT